MSDIKPYDPFPTDADDYYFAEFLMEVLKSQGYKIKTKKREVLWMV